MSGQDWVLHLFTFVSKIAGNRLKTVFCTVIFYSVGLAPPLFTEVNIPCQESGHSCIYLLEVSIFTFFKDVFDWISKLYLDRS